MVISEVAAYTAHFEADELFIRLRQKGKRVSRATVYRTLQLLVNCGIITPIKLGENHTHYELFFGRTDHAHLVCIDCGKVIEFTSANLKALQREVLTNYGFISHGYRVEIGGRCKDCHNLKRES